MVSVSVRVFISESDEPVARFRYYSNNGETCREAAENCQKRAMYIVDGVEKNEWTKNPCKVVFSTVGADFAFPDDILSNLACHGEEYSVYISVNGRMSDKWSRFPYISYFRDFERESSPTPPKESTPPPKHITPSPKKSPSPIQEPPKPSPPKPPQPKKESPKKEPKKTPIWENPLPKDEKEEQDSKPVGLVRNDAEFERQLRWGIAQLELGLLRPDCDKDQARESKKLIASLRSPKTRLIRKRFLLKSFYGDYRKLMEEQPLDEDILAKVDLPEKLYADEPRPGAQPPPPIPKRPKGSKRPRRK